MSYILYLHGFKSSPQSKKAQQTLSYFSKNNPNLEIIVPCLPPAPAEAMELCKRIIESRSPESLSGIIGSSLGGYYALYLSAMHDVRAAIINPAIKPYELLVDYLGENENFHTGEKFIVTADHMSELRELEVEPYPGQNRVLLLTQTGDETLDYHQAVVKLPFAKMWIESGGSHEFEDFERVLPAIADFLT